MNKIVTLLVIGFSLPCFSQIGRIKTGQQIPQQVIQNKDCRDNTATSVRLLGKNPHVPFAIIDKDTIFSAGQPCCLEWATSKSDWYNLNEWGKMVGSSFIKSAQGYDVTQCFELQLETKQGKDGVGLFTSKPVNWELPRSLRWQPNNRELGSFNKLISSVESLIIDRTQKNFVDSTFHGKSIPFRVKINHDNFDTVKCMVYGKRYLLIAYLDKNNNWVLAHLDNIDTNYPFKSFSPFAITDIDKDGLPEIFYQESFGFSYNDKIIKLKSGSFLDNWQIVAICIEGATI